MCWGAHASGASGYILIACIDQSALLMTWDNVSLTTTGALGINERLEDAQINVIWHHAASEKRIPIRCVGGGVWGSTIARHW